MGTRQIALKVRTGQGSAAVAAVPGLTAVEPEVAARPADVPPRPSAPPAGTGPEAVASGAGVTRAPALNWSGGGERSDQEWAVRTLAAAPHVAPPSAGTGRATDQALSAREIELIRSSLAAVEPVADRATAHFYALIFHHHPEVRALFPAAMDVQRDRLFRALLAAARSADDPAGLAAYLAPLGRGHRKYGAVTAHYGPVGECLVAALARYAGHRWSAETESAWRRVYRLISSIMIGAAEEAAKSAPPWWQAEVVAHRLLTPEVAALTLRPDQPYPYRAGQYAMVETPWWPRVWRAFSFATAPRPDGLLTLQVKAVPAGWVSNALVQRAMPGQVLRLGPASGEMVADHGDPVDLLCVGGGTGIAPISALVQEVADHGSGGRSVTVFYGAQCGAELYEVELLKRFSQRNPWLSVRPVVARPDRTVPDALIGELPEVVARTGPWAGRRAYLSGPPAMVRRAAAVLERAGLTAEDIRHDPA